MAVNFLNQFCCENKDNLNTRDVVSVSTSRDPLRSLPQSHIGRMGRHLSLRIEGLCLGIVLGQLDLVHIPAQHQVQDQVYQVTRPISTHKKLSHYCLKAINCLTELNVTAFKCMLLECDSVYFLENLNYLSWIIPQCVTRSVYWS